MNGDNNKKLKILHLLEDYLLFLLFFLNDNRFLLATDSTIDLNIFCHFMK